MIEIELLVDDENKIEMSCMYWATDKDGDFVHSVAAVSRQFSISSNRVNIIVKESCNAFSTSLVCCGCESQYCFKSRPDFTNKKQNIQWECDSCVESRQEELNERKIQELEHAASIRLQDRFSLKSLNFKQSVFLLAIIRYSVSEELEHLKSYNSNKADALSPSDEYDFDMYRELSKNNIIIVSPGTSPDHIELNEESGFSYFINRVEWVLPIDHREHNTTGAFIQALEKKLSSMEWEDDWYEQAKELCNEVALVEAASYLRLVMSEHNFDFVAGDKTILVLQKVLEKYSVAQAYNLIWGAGKDAAAYYMRGGIPKKQAANSVVGGIERRFERALANNWSTKPFNRNFNLPMSTLSQVLYSTTLQTDDGGFKKPTHEVI